MYSAFEPPNWLAWGGPHCACAHVGVIAALFHDGGNTMGQPQSGVLSRKCRVRDYYVIHQAFPVMHRNGAVPFWPRARHTRPGLGRRRTITGSRSRTRLDERATNLLSVPTHFGRRGSICVDGVAIANPLRRRDVWPSPSALYALQLGRGDNEFAIANP